MGFFKRFKKPKANVLLEISNNTVELGGNLRILVSVNSREEFDATEVRLELCCNEKIRRERHIYNKRRRAPIRQVYWDQTTLHSSHTKAADKVHMVPGFKKIFQTDVKIPLASRESYVGSESNVTWLIKGVIAVDDRPDITSKIHGLQIVRAILQSKSQNNIKKIECKYCDTLMDITLSACPNCCAPMKK